DGDGLLSDAVEFATPVGTEPRGRRPLAQPRRRDPVALSVERNGELLVLLGRPDPGTFGVQRLGDAAQASLAAVNNHAVAANDGDVVGDTAGVDRHRAAPHAVVADVMRP